MSRLPLRQPIAPETPEDHVPNTLEPVRKPHFSISGLSSQFGEAKPDGYGELHVPGMQIHPGSRTRVVTVLHYLALELEKRGISASHDEKGIHATMMPDSVRFELTEERRRQKHEPLLRDMLYASRDVNDADNSSHDLVNSCGIESVHMPCCFPLDALHNVQASDLIAEGNAVCRVSRYVDGHTSLSCENAACRDGDRYTHAQHIDFTRRDYHAPMIVLHLMSNDRI
jgi:hypothetical protein